MTPSDDLSNEQIAKTCWINMVEEEDQDGIQKVTLQPIIAALDAKDTLLSKLTAERDGLKKVDTALDDLIKVQEASVTDPYMAGLLNGMLLAKSLFGGEYNPVKCPPDPRLTASQERVRELQHDIQAYRGALGYSVPGDHDGRLWGTNETPICGMCDARNRT